MLPKPRVVVTGAGGFIGSAVISALERKRWPFIALYRTTPARGSMTEQRDLTRMGLVDLIAKGDVVIHLAATLPRTFTGLEATAAAMQNVAIDRRVVLACARSGAHLIFASSTSVYGLGRWPDPITEDHPPDPVGPYAVAKLETELEIADRSPRFATILRVSAPYGPGSHSRTVMRLFLERAAAGDPLRVHGTGQRRQDFIHVSDVANAFIVAAELRPAGTFNIASGQPVSMRELAAEILAVSPASRSTVVLSGHPDPQEGFTANYSVERACRALGWASKVPLRAGLGDWVRAGIGSPQLGLA